MQDTESKAEGAYQTVRPKAEFESNAAGLF